MKKTNSKLVKIISIVFNSFFVLMFLVVFGLGTFFIISVNSSKISLAPLKETYQSVILDKHQRKIEAIGKKSDYVKIEDIPQIVIDALLSVEDSEFYHHEGINTKRIIISLINNIFSSSLQGGSTITQQLVKNTSLTNEQTLTRKAKEAYLSVLLEKEYTKDEILENYFNRVYFEQSIPGIQYASRTFFNKDIQEVNLIEAATLVGLVKSPSFYYPFKNPDNTTKRKNIVLGEMLKNKVITQEEYNLAIEVNVKDILYTKENNDTLIYDYQAYLDLVYYEVKQLTGKDLYTHPLIVETYLDTSLQTYLDSIQKGEAITFSDDNQQIGGIVIDNTDAKIIGVLGGRNYQGKKVFNRGFQLKRNPASTIKPLLSYALGCEHLSYNPLTTIKDEQYNYQGTSINVNNADKKYLGNLSMIEALGYSRNTCAVKTFDAIINKIGVAQVENYLKSLALMDEGKLTSSYALGGYNYGISPLSIAGGYSMLANHGRYLKPSTVSKITDYEGNVLYQRDLNSTQIIKEESADMITYSLNKVIEKNYLSIGSTKPFGVPIAGKTGTNAYDKRTIKQYNYPNNADKDIWFAGYSPSYTCAIWTGFDKPENEKNYFTYNDSRRKISKQLFKNIMEKINLKNQKFIFNENLKKTYLVKGLEDNYLPNELVPSSFIEETIVPSQTKFSILPNINFQEVKNVNIISSFQDIIFEINDKITEDQIYSTFYGDKTYILEVTLPDNTKIKTTSIDGLFKYTFTLEGNYHFSLYIGFENNHDLHGKGYEFDYLYTLL